MTPTLAHAVRAVVAAGALVGAGAAHALIIPTVVATLDSSSYSTTFSSSTDGFDPSTLATWAYVYSSPVVSASSNDWTTPITATEPDFPAHAPTLGTASASQERAITVAGDYLVNVNRYGQFTLGAGQSFTASINYSLARYDAEYAGTLPGGASVELQVLGHSDATNYTDLLAQSRRFLGSTGTDSTVQGTLAVTFTNTSASAETFRLAMNANTGLSVAAVPEPASLAMSMTGGMILWLLAAHHRRQS